MKYLLSLLIIITSLTACRPKVTVPKPRGYFRTEFPAHQYRQFDSADFPYSFEYPVYATIARDTNLLEGEHEPYWIDVIVPQLNATIYLTYKRVSANESIDKLVEESYRLSYAHDKKADYISDTAKFRSDNGLQGVVYAVGGNAASAYQFFATDSKQNFIRGALYFNAVPNADSLRPAINFMKKDMDHLMQTLKFKQID